MPGTTYTREGPEGDPLGRLADFARFAVLELDELVDEIENISADVERDVTLRSAMETLRYMKQITVQLDGFTTADDS